MKRAGALPPVSSVVKTMDAVTVRSIRDLVVFRTPTEALMADPVFYRELALLRVAEQRYRKRGIDIRDYLDFKVSHPAIIDWQARSDEIVERRPGVAGVQVVRRGRLLGHAIHSRRPPSRSVATTGGHPDAPASARDRRLQGVDTGLLHLGHARPCRRASSDQHSSRSP